MTATGTLPIEFAALEPYLAWALPNEEKRQAHRLQGSYDDLLEFFHAMMPMREKIAGYLGQYPVDGLPGDAMTLYDLAITFASIAPYAEYYGSNRVPNSFNEERFLALPR